MARTIPAAALTELATNLGTEPINIIEIEWVDGTRISYADRDIEPGIKGGILEISDLDDVVDINGGGTSQQITLKLSDASGELKDVLDNNDIHKRPCWVYQWFEGLALADKFLIFRGQISSPVSWNESARTLQFDIITQLEDKETGFSPEEGQFPEIPSEMIGVPWPMAFGTVLDMPAVNVNKSISGTTQSGIGIISGKDLVSGFGIFTHDNSDEAGLGVSLALAAEQSSVMALAAQSYKGTSSITTIDGKEADSPKEVLLAGVNEISKQNSLSLAELDGVRKDYDGMIFDQEEGLETGEGPNVIKVLGGEDFPQGQTVRVQIGAGIFTGVFDCQTFRIQNRSHPENEQAATNAADLAKEVQVSPGGGGPFDVSAVGFGGEVFRRHGHIIGAPVLRRAETGNILQHFWAEAGSEVRLADDQEQNFIVSIVPGTVLTVKAYKQFEGVKRLVSVPNNLWTQVNRNYGLDTGNVATVRLTQRLSSLEGQGWEDDIFVIFQSSIGPNTVAIMEWLILHYSTLSTDTASFADVTTKLTPFPSHFAVFDRRQVIDLLKDIAFQARCAIFINDGKYFLKYLPVEPGSEATITEADVVHQTLSVGLTPTEDLVTKMDVTWRPTYAPEIQGEDVDSKFILRHNVEKYGVQEQSFDWFIYAQPDIIRKAATFWMIRLSNTWKKMTFETKLNLLNVETLDGVTLNFAGDFAGSSSYTGIVENATYNSTDNTISFEILTPIKAGTMIPYVFFWPFAVAGNFPANGDFAGGAGIGIEAVGQLPTGSIEIGQNCVDGNGIFIGGPNIVYSGPADLGDPTPADTNFVAQDRIITNTDFTVDGGVRPTPDLAIKKRIRVSPYPEFTIPIFGGIDIRKTLIYDSDNDESATLDTFLKEITEDDGIVIDTSATFGDGTNSKEFDFKFDTDGEKFGAGTAFLQDESEEE